MKKTIKQNSMAFDIPYGIGKGYYLEIFDGKEAVLTGDFEITELEETVLKIKCDEHSISFYGSGLEIINYSANGIRIGGVIKSLDFL